MPQSLLEQVEHTREKMIQLALEKGFGDVDTIQLSEKLDQLLNAYQLKNSKTNDHIKII
ncbi:aspartyl-phosphate phosphatase Spo0E family protein [Paenisporosarcina sp. TG20]|uniref:aspartyl-phosphate phosphatase Spo0E family protein n=1 Tax=Paenisporosarcina sp. TG20 TaxID=1211706 RepID=UPI0002F2CD52|nr:aspartyl-phosphate phosphatase Spo0E family protein [Paenisporosarcina sp. TG20]